MCYRVGAELRAARWRMRPRPFSEQRISGVSGWSVFKKVKSSSSRALTMVQASLQTRMSTWLKEILSCVKQAQRPPAQTTHNILAAFIFKVTVAKLTLQALLSLCCATLWQACTASWPPALRRSIPALLPQSQPPVLLEENPLHTENNKTKMLLSILIVFFPTLSASVAQFSHHLIFFMYLLTNLHLSLKHWIK